MFSDQIEQLKNQYTDKYVAVDATRAELARFRDLVGQVKTVNMSGRALVEFMDYHLNIGWYDIDLSCLKVVDKPSEEEQAKKAAARKPAEKPAAKASPASAGGSAPAKPAAKPAAGKMSVAEMMAAARANKGGAAEAPAAKSEAKPAAPKASPASAGGSEAAPAKVDRSKMSVADMLAAARGNKPTGEASAPEAAAAPAAKPAPKAVPEKPAAPAESAADAPAGESTKIDRSKMSVAEMLAYARKSDSK